MDGARLVGEAVAYEIRAFQHLLLRLGDRRHHRLHRFRIGRESFRRRAAALALRPHPRSHDRLRAIARTAERTFHQSPPALLLEPLAGTAPGFENVALGERSGSGWGKGVAVKG